MPRRMAVLPTSPRAISNSSLFPALSCEGCALLHQSEAHSVSFQSLPHSFARTPGRHQVRFPNSVDSSQPSNLPTFNALSPLEATLIDDLRVLPEISRNRPHATPAESTLTRNSRCNPFRSNTYKKQGGGGVIVLASLPSSIDRQLVRRSLHQRFRFVPTLFRFDASPTHAIILPIHGEPLYLSGFVPNPSVIFRGDSCPPNCVIFSLCPTTSSSN